MFRLPELDCFNAMLTRLYKQELEEIVMRYEVYRFVTIIYSRFNFNSLSEVRYACMILLVYYMPHYHQKNIKIL